MPMPMWPTPSAVMTPLWRYDGKSAVRANGLPRRAPARVRWMGRSFHVMCESAPWRLLAWAEGRLGMMGISKGERDGD